MTQSESGGGSRCVRTSKGPQNPSQGFIKACQLFNWTFLDRISSINFIISLAILDTSYLNMHFFGTHTCLFSQNGKKLAAERLKYEPFTVNTSTLVSPLFNPCCHSVSIEATNTRCAILLWFVGRTYDSISCEIWNNWAPANLFKD